MHEMNDGHFWLYWFLRDAVTNFTNNWPRKPEIYSFTVL